MSRLFYHVMQDNAGNLLFDVSGTMRLAGSGTLATIYGDEALTVILPNPMTNHASFGSFKCFLGAGDYDFYMAKSGYTFETLTGVQGHGTMAQQNASAVAITGGTAVLTDCQSNRFYGPNRAGNDVTGFVTDIAAAGGTGRFGLYASGTAQNYLAGPLGIGGFTPTSVKVYIAYLNSEWGVVLKPAATGVVTPMQFMNSAGTGVGSITTNDTTTAYNTSSDSRLKRDISPLTGALDVVQRLRPSTGLWRADGSRWHSFLAHEVADVVDGVVTGEPDAVDEEGNIQPQQIDLSKLVPWLVGACQDLAQQVAALTARLEAAGA